MSSLNEETPNASRALQQRMAEIAARFLARSQQDLDAMDQLLLRIRAGAPEAPLELKQLAHRVNGAAAALGFPELSTHAANVEALTTVSAAGPVLQEAVQAIALEATALRVTLADLLRASSR